MGTLFQTMSWNALEASILALAIALVLRVRPLTAPARHALWLIVLAKLLAPPLGIRTPGYSACCMWGADMVTRLGAAAPTGDPDGATAEQPSAARAAPLVAPAPAVVAGAAIARDGALAAPHSADGMAAMLLGPLGEPTGAPAARDGGLLGDPVESLAGVLPDLAGSRGIAAVATAEPSHTAEQLEQAEWAARGGEPPAGLPYGQAFVAAVRGGALVRGPVVLVGLWGAGTLVVVAAAALRIARFAVAVAGAPAADAELVELSRSMARRLGLPDTPPVRVLAWPVSPLLWALARPVVVLPASLVQQSDRRLLESVLAHELAHLKRRDHWGCWIELAALTLYWWLPTFWWARRSTRRAADQAADACAVACVGDRHRYADALLTTVQLLRGAPPAVLTLGRGLGERDALQRRLTMIMREPLCHRLSWPARLGAGLLALWILPAAPAAVRAQAAPDKPSADVGNVAASADAAPQDAPKADIKAPDAERAITETATLDIDDDGVRTVVAAVQDNDRRGPNDDRGRRGRPDPDQRIRELEEKMDRIMDELRAMRGERGRRDEGGPGREQQPPPGPRRGPRPEGPGPQHEGGQPPREGGQPPREGGQPPREGGQPPREGGPPQREGGPPQRDGGERAERDRGRGGPDRGREDFEQAVRELTHRMLEGDALRGEEMGRIREQLGDRFERAAEEAKRHVAEAKRHMEEPNRRPPGAGDEAQRDARGAHEERNLNRTFRLNSDGGAMPRGEGDRRRPQIEIELRGVDIGPEQRERIEQLEHELQAGFAKIEAQQHKMQEEFQRQMAELQRARGELEAKRAEAIREIVKSRKGDGPKEREKPEPPRDR